MPEIICQMAESVKWQPAHLLRRPCDRAYVARKSEDDRKVEARIRAHIRQQMRERSIDKAEAARRIRSDNGNFSRILNEGRGIGISLIMRICHGLKITPSRLLEEDPPSEFFAVGAEEPGARPAKR
jgi:DNA-binding Xre family transcriptional regulator